MRGTDTAGMSDTGADPAADRPPQHAELRRFLLREARYLDEKRWDAWLALYADDGDYWAPLSPQQPDPLNHASLFYEDRLLMRLRIRRFAHPHAFSQQPPSRTVHLVSNVMLDGFDPKTGACTVNSRFLMLDYRREHCLVFGGAYTHSLVRVGGDFRIRRKRVDLINSDAPHESIQIYF